MEQEKCEKIQEMLDQLDNGEQKFALWYLLQYLIEEYEAEIKDYAECKDKQELATQFMIQRNRRALQEVRECLGYDLWG